MNLTKTVSLYQIALKFMILFAFKHFSKPFSFFIIFVNLYTILSIERHHPVGSSSNNKGAIDIMSQLMFSLLKNMRFQKRFVSGQYLSSFFSSLSTFKPFSSQRNNWSQ